MPSPKRLAADLAASAAVPFLAIWIYEGTNWIAMACQGYSATLTVSGWLPLGVSAVSSAGVSPLTKVLQVVLAIAFLVPFGSLFGRSKMLLSKTLVVSTAGVFIASAYWEMLSVADAVPVALHTIIFAAGASTISFVTLWAFDRSRKFHPAVSVPGRS